MDYKNKRILIFGLGLNEGGVGSAKFFANQGAIVRITDLKNEIDLDSSINQLKDFKNIEYVLGKHQFEDIDWADLIIKNPGVKPNNEFIKYAKEKGKEIEMDMGIFLQFVDAKNIIGVTGTKGKSTVSTLIYEVLKSTNKKVIFAGNIGKSVLATIPHLTKDSLVVLEISSFQLEAFDQHKISPHIAILTNIYPDHLNYYPSIDEYIAAKKLIAKYQTSDDFLFLRESDPVTSQKEFLDGLKSQIEYFSANDLDKKYHPNLLGKHNLENIACALQVIRILEIAKEKALEVMKKFKGVEFRTQLIFDKDVKIYNDTTATGPDPAIMAMETIPYAIVIAGGMNKGMDYANYVTELEKNAKEVFFLEGDATDEILSLLRENKSNLLIHGPFSDLEDLLIALKSKAKKGDIILFSPAATSFNMFQNEFDRGRKFNQLVEKIFA